MNNNYHIIRIQQYLNGELNDDEMYRLEREALDDPLLQDAIDGYRMQQEVSHRRLSLLQQRLAARIADQAKERDAFFFGWQRLGVAATACVLMVLVLVLLWMRNHHLQPKVTEKEVKVELAPVVQVHAQAAGDEREFDAMPNDGWQQFNAYLSEIKEIPAIKGQIVLAFKIDPAGKPYAIQAIGKADTLLITEAKRFLEEGPVWKGKKGKIALSFE
ncbi:hypothetical protein [Parapedobacter indicus]|uniref:Uncharacterized protein n=1 Tax=Parapedobacter indicus TaxID=1477437 RepID=A0A1I3N871_9SPHI|nr:hypothetical protein [Parapedobacter indicus]PPL00909.1 hypothetical protein CLV26_107129 [Parapedobacter indicus]SFJ05438.1 hypothetical protein SAMN05444682_107129 [Parapedobacter indicus]